MKLIFFIDGHAESVCVVEGECTNYSFGTQPNGVTFLDMDIKVTELKIETNRDTTKIMPLPGATHGHVRIKGATKFRCINDMVYVSFTIEGIYPNKEEACAAEMKQQIEESNEITS